MKRIFLVLFIMCIILCGCNKKDDNKITKDVAYQGVDNYCHKEYDWSIAEDNPNIMYVSDGNETDTEYQFVFRSYTGSFVYFYVNKETGSTSMVEYVPSINETNELGTINILDYIYN